jgi:PKD repeat protein
MSGAAIPGPQHYTIEAWIKTTTTKGGKIIGFGNSATGGSSTYDRHLYMTNSGAIAFGSYVGSTVVTITSPGSYNNGQWHHVAASIGAAGMQLFADGSLVASSTTLHTSAGGYTGYWRVGGDSLSGWPNKPANTAFTGAIDEVAIYPSQLGAAQLANHVAAAAGGGANQAPTASFTVSANGLTATFNGSGSSDLDGTIASYAWDFGDGATGTGASVQHTYADAAASYTVTLTVTDNGGATGTKTQVVAITPPANTAPTASFTPVTSGLTLTADGSASNDPDGSIASYAWDFGDGATATGATASHAFAAAGTYPVKLTVTDNRGATGSTTSQVTVTATTTGQTLAADAFGREVASGWGSADTGGAWVLSASGSTLNVTGGAGQMSVPAGRTATARLAAVSSTATDYAFSVGTDTALTGGGVYLSPVVRSVSPAADYRVKLRIMATGQVTGAIDKVDAGTESALTTTVTVPGVTYTTGARLLVRVQATGTSPSTIRYRVWLQGTSEPATWTQTITDSTASLQAAGGVGVVTYTSSSSTAAVLLKFDDLSAAGL